jgi:alpha-beta hydrolase superfamily lysophospholipase
MNSVDELIEDAYTVTQYIKKLYPEKPLYIVGHSLGSILARCYLRTHETEIEKLIMTGTIKPIAQLPMKLWLFTGNWVTFFFGPRKHSKFLHIVGGSTIYKSFPYEGNFVTTDKEMFENMSADPLMHFTWTNKGALTMLEAVSRLKQYKNYSALNPNLQILSLSGTKDPMTGGDLGLKDTVQTLRKIGYSHILTRQYDGKLHSILLETNRSEVYQDILDFLKE